VTRQCFETQSDIKAKRTINDDASVKCPQTGKKHSKRKRTEQDDACTGRLFARSDSYREIVVTVVREGSTSDTLNRCSCHRLQNDALTYLRPLRVAWWETSCKLQSKHIGKSAPACKRAFVKRCVQSYIPPATKLNQAYRMLHQVRSEYAAMLFIFQDAWNHVCVNVEP